METESWLTKCMENTNEGCVQPWEEQDKAPPGTLLTYVKPLHPSSLPFLLTSLHLNSSSPTCAALIPSEFWSWQMVPPAGTEVQFIENPPSHIYLLWFSIFYTLLSFSLFLSHHDLCLNVKVWEPKPAWLEPFGSSSCGSSWCWNISFMFPFFCFSVAEHEVTGTFLLTSPTENTPAHSDGNYQHLDFSEDIWGRSPFSVRWRLRSPETRTKEKLTWNEGGRKLSRI